jgi:hypothetical protein
MIRGKQAWAAALLTTLLAAAPSAAEPVHSAGSIANSGPLFSADAIQRADRRLRELTDRTGCALVIVATEYLPHRKESIWYEATSRVVEDHCDICLRIEEGDHRRQEYELGIAVRQEFKKRFTPAMENRLKAILTEQFDKKEFDAGLLAGIEYVEQVLPSLSPSVNVGNGQEAERPPGFSWVWLIVLIVGGGLTLVLLLGVIRAFAKSVMPRSPSDGSASRNAAPGDGSGPGGDGRP